MHMLGPLLKIRFVERGHKVFHNIRENIGELVFALSRSFCLVLKKLIKLKLFVHDMFIQIKLIYQQVLWRYC